MEFWGVEVKPGQALEVTPEFDKIIHLSQAALGESKDKGKESIPLLVKIGDKKLVLGTLSPEACPQLAFDLVFEQKFELSHNWKKGSVYFLGYQTIVPEEEDSEDDSDYDEEVPLVSVNGNLEPKAEPSKPDAAKPESLEKPKMKVVDPKKENKSKKDEDDEDDDEDDSNDDDEDDSEDDESDDEEMVDGEDSSDEEEDDEDQDEETPKKAEASKKRPNDSATKTPASKKSKLVSPPKTGGKKGGHTATPHPSKQAAKSPGTNDKAKTQTPKSGGQISCKSCSKTFNSEGALQNHSKAKHGGK